MLHQSPESFGETFALTHPASHWTGAVKVRFLDCLSQRGNARLAARRVGLSPETAYRQRRRDPAFARAWAAALVLAQRESEQVLADRAIDGVEEQVWYRGEVVGTRRRYDTRLLLAHLARLDRLAADDPGAVADAERFDELLAVIAGETADEVLTGDGELIPPDRGTHAREAAGGAGAMAGADWDGAVGDDDDLDDDEYRQYRAHVAEIEAGVRAEALAHWDEWRARAHRAVDGVLDEPDGSSDPRTPAPGAAKDASGPRQQRQHLPCGPQRPDGGERPEFPPPD